MDDRFFTTPLRILLVEDSRAEAIYIERTLTQSNSLMYKVYKAQTIAAAVTLLSENAFDVVLLDLGLPDISGFEGLRTILNVAPKIPVVILTGRTDAETEQGAMENGAQDYLLKELASVSALTRAMRHAIQRKQVENMKSELISLISHELRTPLTSIHGSLGLLNSSLAGELPVKAANLVGIAYRNSERLIALINDVLDVEKMDSSQMIFTIKAQPIADVVSQAVDMGLHYAQRHNVQLQSEETTQGLQINVDASRTVQILGNFISNAIKYSPPGAAVNLTTRLDGGWIYLAVKDCGPGISEEFKTRIFSKFSQADGALTRQKGGAGLGLYISKQMAERMGGRVGFESEPGQGSVFWVSFPCAVNGEASADCHAGGTSNDYAA